MKPFSLHLLLLCFLSTTAMAAFVCDVPTNGCTNGMFNQAKCECECIEPFCPDAFGDCTVPTSNCGGNPWKDCEKGVNCPWWANLHDQEGSCKTGNEVPAGRWIIFSTQEACCVASFSNSYDECAPTTEEAVVVPPTKYPTLQVPEEDNKYELFSLRFDVKGLRDDFSLEDLKEEMSTALRQILILLSERIEGLKLMRVEEKMQRRLQALRSVHSPDAHIGRMLQESLSLYYNVNVLRDKRKRFGSLIIGAMRDNYMDLLDLIQTSPDINYIKGEDIELNFCTLRGGEYSYCVSNANVASSAITVDNNEPTKNSPDTDYYSPASASDNNNFSAQPSKEGLATWAIVLIVLGVFALLFCIGLCIIFFGYDGKSDDSLSAREIKDKLFFDDEKTRASHGRIPSRSRHSIAESTGHVSHISRQTRRSTAKTNNEFDIVLTTPQDPKFTEGSFSINTYTTRKSKKNKAGRDPTVYNPDQGDKKPDPDAGGGSVSSQRRYYYDEGEEPPPKARRDPTMYIDGRSCYTEESSLEANHDPATYAVKHHQLTARPYSQSVPAMYMGGVQSPDSSYSQSDGTEEKPNKSYGWDEDQPIAHERSKFANGAGTRTESADSHRYKMEDIDESYRTQDKSIHTQEPSLSGRSKKSRNGNFK